MEAAMKLYDFGRSGNCYKIRLFLSILAIDYTKIPVDLAAGENLESGFLAINPDGLVPVLIDGQVTVHDSAAILAYLARAYADDNWLPNDPVAHSRVIRWLAFEQSEVRFGLARARAIAAKSPSLLARLGTLEESQEIGKLALKMLDRQLAESRWLAGGPRPTICDIACYPYTAMSPQGGLSLEPYPAVRRWLGDIEMLEGYIPISG
jgi:glutathione S-transferase